MQSVNSALQTQEILTSDIDIRVGSALELVSKIPEDSIQTCITSPPYWGLRDYDIQDQIGAEASVDEYIQNLVAVFAEIRKALKPDGTLWLNIGDSYTSGGRTWRAPDAKNKGRAMKYRPPTPEGLKPKDLVGVPWKLAFALQADGWYLRSDIIWNKPNCQPESVKDRPTRAHEYLFLLSKSERYFYDAEAIKEEATTNGRPNGARKNRRTVWNVNTEGYSGAHFAVFPKELVRYCMLAGSDSDTTVLDPFFGAGTVGLIAQELGRSCIGIELNPEYAELASERLRETLRGLAF